MAQGDSLRKNGPIGMGGAKGVDVTTTSMLNTTAREAAVHNSADNKQTKDVSSHKPFGELGGRGMGGAC